MAEARWCDGRDGDCEEMVMVMVMVMAVAIEAEAMAAEAITTVLFMHCILPE